MSRFSWCHLLLFSLFPPLFFWLNFELGAWQFWRWWWFFFFFWANTEPSFNHHRDHMTHVLLIDSVQIWWLFCMPFVLLNFLFLSSYCCPSEFWQNWSRPLLLCSVFCAFSAYPLGQFLPFVFAWVLFRLMKWSVALGSDRQREEDDDNCTDAQSYCPCRWRIDMVTVIPILTPRWIDRFPCCSGRSFICYVPGDLLHVLFEFLLILFFFFERRAKPLLL